jgi:hypothetical protein
MRLSHGIFFAKQSIIVSTHMSLGLAHIAQSIAFREAVHGHLDFSPMWQVSLYGQPVKVGKRMQTHMALDYPSHPNLLKTTLRVPPSSRDGLTPDTCCVLHPPARSAAILQEAIAGASLVAAGLSKPSDSMNRTPTILDPCTHR